MESKFETGPTITFLVDATEQSCISSGFEYDGTGAMQNVHVSAYIDTPELAAEIAAQFPKSIKVRSGRISGGGPDYTNADGSRRERGYIKVNASLVKNGVNGGVNETGIRRVQSFVKAARKLGHTVEYAPRFKNSISRERFAAEVAEV